jgi:secreted trypsin-like serine protease
MIFLAHCIYTRNLTRFSVLAGTPNLLDNWTGQRRDLAECRIHPEFNGGITTKSSDLAVCRLSSPLEFNGRVNKIEIESKSIGGGVNCTLTGWGGLSIYRTYNISFWNLMAYPMFLQTIDLPTITNEQCNEMWNT